MKGIALIVTMLCLFVFSGNAFCALVTGNTAAQSINFGSVASGSAGGTITSSGTVTGTIKGMGGNQSGQFTITGTSVLGTFSNTIRVFLVNNSTTLRSGGNSMNVVFSLSSGSTVTQQDYSLSSGSVTVAVYGTLTVASSQSAGSYSGSYTLVACSCSTLGCPTTSVDTLCI